MRKLLVSAYSEKDQAKGTLPALGTEAFDYASFMEGFWGSDDSGSRYRNVTTNYEEDSYRLVLGRYVLLGVKWNFGKMNAAHSQRASRAAMDMPF